jgi:type IV pilus assembly protein PilE
MTLIEHMVAVSVTAIIMAVAVPSYSAYLQRGFIVDATQALATYSGRLESSFDSNGNYGIGACAVAAPAATEQWGFACALLAGGQGFRITATGSGPMAGHAFTLDDAGNRRTTAFPNVVGARECWLVRGTEC